MAKNSAYHESAVLYNQHMADMANELVGMVEDEEVRQWCRSVAKQHEFHLERHEKALAKLTAPKPEEKPKKKGRRRNNRRRRGKNRHGRNTGPQRNGPQTEAERQAEFAAQQEAEPMSVGVETVLPEDQNQEAHA